VGMWSSATASSRVTARSSSRSSSPTR
jgi:hypothetical protein